MAKARWIIAVAPPARYGEPFDIPEWSYTHACQTARRYRQRGWRACVVRGPADRGGVSMDRAEARIRDLAVEILKVCREHGTKGFLSLAVRDCDEGGYVSFFNSFWPGGEDEGRPIDYHDNGIDLEKE